jgi:hypothetical protein
MTTPAGAGRAQLPPVEAPQYDDPGRGPGGAAPDLQRRTVVGVFAEPTQADAAVAALQDAGHAAEDVTVVTSGAAAPARGAGDTAAGKGAARGGAGGAVLGGALGLVAAAGLQVGALGAAEPVALVAGGAVVGGAAGALVGSFAGLGTPTRRAERVEAAARSGGVQVAVAVADPAAAAGARAALLRLGAREVQGYQPAL